MKSLTVILLLSLLLARPGLAQTQRYGWTIDKAHTQIGFAVQHLMISEVDGLFHDFDGTMQISTEDFTQTQVYFKVKVASVDTRIEMRDNDLRSASFFDAARYPYIEFKSTRIERQESGRYLMHGNLTIRNVTKPIVLNIKYQSISKDTNGKVRLGFNITGELNRFQYGLAWNKLTDWGGAIVGERVTITCNLEMVRD